MASRKTGLRKKKRRCKQSMKIQSVLLPRDKYNQRTAKKWLREHGFAADLDIKKNTFRARQHDPSEFENFRVIPFGSSGIKAVVGC